MKEKTKEKIITTLILIGVIAMSIIGGKIDAGYELSQTNKAPANTRHYLTP